MMRIPISRGRGRRNERLSRLAGDSRGATCESHGILEDSRSGPTSGWYGPPANEQIELLKNNQKLSSLRIAAKGDEFELEIDYK